MNHLGLVIISGLLCCQQPAAAQEESKIEAVILSELRALRKDVQKIMQRIEKLEKMLEQIQKKTPAQATKKESAPPSGEKSTTPEKAPEGLEEILGEGGEELGEFKEFLEGMNERRGPDLKSLRAIKLPEDPDRKQVEAYITAILEASVKQNAYSAQDPQIGMFVRLGREWLAVMLDFASQKSGRFFIHNYHLNKAIELLANSQDKLLILNVLSSNHELVSIVVIHGWEEDAREILLDEIKKSPDYLPIEWITAVANLQDPTTYDDLKKHLIKSLNPSMIYDLIKDLPDIELEDTVAEAWTKVQKGKKDRSNEWSINAMARIAAGYGHKDALDMLIKELEEESTWFAPGESTRDVLLKYLPMKGTNREIKTWYKKHRDQLIFEPKKGKYVTAETF